MEIFKLFGSVFIKTDDAEKSLSKVEDKGEKVGKSMGEMAGQVGKFALGIGTVALSAAGALAGVAMKSAETADRVDKLSAKIGLSKQGFQEWDYIMAQNGMDVEKLQVGVKTLTNLMDGANSGNKEAIKTFGQLGLTWKDNNGKLKTQEQMMNDSIMALAKMENGTEKAKMATELFGKAGLEMMPMLNNGAEGIQQLKDRAHELGLVMSDDAVNAGVVLGDTIDDVKKSFGAIATKIGVSVMPVIQKMADWLLEKMPIIQKVLEVVFKGLEWGVNLVGDILSQFFDYIGNALSDVSINWSEVWGMCQNVFKAWAEYIKTYWENIGKPIFDLIIDMVGWVYNIFMEYWPMISEFFGQFTSDCMVLWEEHLKPMLQAIGDYIKYGLAPMFELVFNNIIGPVVGACFKGIIDLWNNSLKPMFTGIIDFITGIFTGDWKKAFEGLSNIIAGIFGGLESIVKAPINAIIGMVNKMIDGLNTLSLPEWLGGGGIDIPKIPMLAQGTDYFKGGYAIVGEQGPELVEMPRGSRVIPNGETESMLNKEIYIVNNTYLDGKLIATETKKAISREQGQLNIGKGRLGFA